MIQFYQYCYWKKKTKIVECALSSNKCSHDLLNVLVCSICYYGIHEKKSVKRSALLSAIFQFITKDTFSNPSLAAITGRSDPSLMHRHLELPSAASCQQLLHALSKWVYYFEWTSLKSLTGDMAWTVSVAWSMQILEKPRFFSKFLAKPNY